MNEELRKKQIDAITNQNKRLEALTNKDDHKSLCKEIFDKIIQEKFDGIKELTYKIDHNDLIYFKNNTVEKFLMILIMVQNFLKKCNLV